MKGTVSYIAQRYSEANNKYVESCNKDKTSKDIIYAISMLLRWTKARNLSVGRFEWVKNVA